MGKMRSKLKEPIVRDLTTNTNKFETYNSYTNREYVGNDYPTFFDFEVLDANGENAQNIFNEYLKYFADGDDGLLVRITFDREDSAFFSFNAKLISTLCYGTPALHYLILQLNNIKASDLTTDYLVYAGITTLSSYGIDKLIAVMDFKKRMEGKENSRVFYKED